MAEREPAAIRYKNPGAQWPGPRATKWGSTHYVTLNDGQGNKIAVFPTFVQGAAAQFDLWASNYTGMTLKAAIEKWSGHNSPASYVAFLEKSTGISINTKVTKALLASPAGWKLLKAQSHWEAGQPIPMTDAEWQLAQTKVFGPATAAQNVALPTSTYSTDVKRVQSDLIALGYHEVGDADGLIGGKTRGAITAFLGDRGIIAAAGISPALTAEIAKAKGEGWSRPVAPKRAYATAKDIAPKVPAVAATQRAGLWSQVMGWLGFAGAAGQGVMSVLPTANDQVSPYLSMFQGWFKWLADIPGWVPMLIVAIVAFIIWNENRKSKNAAVADYQTGRLN
ncbi:MAG: hypothetical protein WBF99_12135 [Xanthobacteraceae bacterium]